MNGSKFDLGSFLLGGAAFVALSYVCHCKFGLGPWACQRADPRRSDAVLSFQRI